MLQFLTLTIGLSIGLAAIVAAAYRLDVGRNWEERRCDLGVVAMAGFFKPATDTRTATQFARDNWSFCEKEYVQNGIRAAAAIPKELADAEAAIAGVVGEVSSAVADVFFDLWKFCYEAYSSFMDSMKGAAKLFHNFMIQLHSIVGRLQGAALSIVYGLIALIVAYISATQLVLIVAIIIIGILIALQIILFFILLPISGLIITVTAIISVVVVAVATAIAAAMVSEMFTPGACFATDTPILVKGGTVPIQRIRLGDRLADGGYVTAVHEFYLKESLWILDGIQVTGDHLVQDPDNSKNRIRVSAHSEAVSTSDSKRQRLWCLTTSTRCIPVKGRLGALIFADWEEIDGSDTSSQYEWYCQVWRTLNPTSGVVQSPPARVLQSDAGLSPDCQVPVRGWFGPCSKRADHIKIGDWLYTDSGVTQVVGRVETAGDQITDAVELGSNLVSIGTWARQEKGRWAPPTEQPVRDIHPDRWIHFYTTAGEFRIGDWSVRDASDVGLANLSELVDKVILNPC